VSLRKQNLQTIEAQVEAQEKWKADLNEMITYTLFQHTGKFTSLSLSLSLSHTHTHTFFSVSSIRLTRPQIHGGTHPTSPAKKQRTRTTC
jgi:hypothetical protein